MASKLIVPYKMLIEDGRGLNIGDVFTVKGKIRVDAKSVEFNLRHRYGVAFHCKPRFDENVTVFNTWGEGGWNRNEERAEMPWIRGGDIEITIICRDNCFEVLAVNNLVHTYSYRYTALEEIDVFDIRGDLTLESVTFKSG